MRYLFLFFLYVIPLFSTPPQWYISQSIEYKNYEIIGYGEGNTLEEAKQIAKSDIAKSIQTKISSNIEIIKYISNNSYSKNVSKKLKEETNVMLSNLETVKTNYYDNKYYIAIKYIHLPFAKKVRILLNDINNLQKDENEYLNRTTLLNELKNEFGFYPKVELMENKLIINNKSFNLSKKEFIKLFAKIESDAIKVYVKENLENQEFYFIDININKKGFFSLFQIYENGETVLLISNKKVFKNNKIVFPNPNEYDGLQAIVPNEQLKTKDLLFAVLCKDKKDFSLFDNISIDETKYFSLFGDLLNITKDCILNTSVLNIN